MQWLVYNSGYGHTKVLAEAVAQGAASVDGATSKGRAQVAGQDCRRIHQLRLPEQRQAQTLVDLVIFAMQHGMIWVGLDTLPGNNHSKGSTDDLNRLGAFVGAMAQSNADQGPDVAPPTSDRRTAEAYGRRIAQIAAWRTR